MKREKDAECWKMCLEGKSVEVERKEEIQQNMSKCDQKARFSAGVSQSSSTKVSGAKMISST